MKFRFLEGKESANGIPDLIIWSPKARQKTISREYKPFSKSICDSNELRQVSKSYR